jgi:glucose/arabinose dehydrogenase
MLVAVGAPSDQCLVGPPSSKDSKPDGTTFCAQSEGDYMAAGIRRYTYLGDGKWSSSFTVMARGLRNSVAMVRHSSGTLLQAENSVDFAPADTPFEEFNVLKEGAHYGWPYCYDMHGTNPIWGPKHVMDCNGSAYTPPVRLLPPHSAPLSMLYYDGKMFPELKGKLILSMHGYRVAGARIGAFTVDAKGVPVLTPNAHYAAYAGRTATRLSACPIRDRRPNRFCSRQAGITWTAAIPRDRPWDWPWPRMAPSGWRKTTTPLSCGLRATGPR